MVRREVVGAHYGLRAWFAQRVTAVVMLVYTALFLIALARLPQLDFAHWQALWSETWMRYATVLFLLSVLYHAWVGMRNILMDYARPWGLRLALHMLVMLALVWYGAWALQILWGL